MFSTVATKTYFPINSVERFAFLILSPPAFVIFGLFSHGHFECYEVVPHCSFDLHQVKHFNHKEKHLQAFKISPDKNTILTFV